MNTSRRRSLALILVIITFFISISASPHKAIEQKSSEQIIWPEIKLDLYITGLDHPVHITNAHDGTYRLFVVEQVGQIRIIQNNQLLPTPFLNIRERVRSPWENGGGNEEGMLSVAFPGNFNQSGYFYVYYTNLNGDNVVARFSTTDNPNIADPDSEFQILYLNHPNHLNHNGGQLVFGPDGYLYIGTGDGGGSGDPDENAQNPNSLLGKILRIDVEGSIEPYSIPATNPYTQTSGYRGEIWALGLRNPWRFSFDRQTNDLYIGDVGQNRIEEIDFQPAGSSGGENYGWDILEGSLCYEPPNDCVPPENNVFPVAEYEHGANDSNGCSVSGGYVYRGGLYPHMTGIYYFADYCTAKIWGVQSDLNFWTDILLWDSDQPYAFSTFGEDELGNLLIADRAGGIIYHITGTFVRHKFHLPIVFR